jgi:hypothetical protein
MVDLRRRYWNKVAWEETRATEWLSTNSSQVPSGAMVEKEKAVHD